MGEQSEIVDGALRHSAITSQSIGVSELEAVLKAVPKAAAPKDYETAIIEHNVLGLKTMTSREWRFATLRRLYALDPESLLFRALRDVAEHDPAAHPLLACLCALARDTVFRATAGLVVRLPLGEAVSSGDFISPIEQQYPGAYREGTIATIAKKAYASWGQTGHLSAGKRGTRTRSRAHSTPGTVAYALLLGHLEGSRGEALFDTLWSRVLDQPRSGLYDLAAAASRYGMLEFRNAGGVVDVSFNQLLRPFEGQPL